MGRLIDADKLKESIPPTHVDIFENCRNCRLLDEEQVRNLIDEQPTACADTVYAYWIKHEYAEEVDGYLIPNYECSNCHSWLRDNRNYCGDCGARMKDLVD